MDLLSGDSYSSPGSESPPEFVVDISLPNTLPLSDSYPQTNNTTDALGFLDEQTYLPAQFQHLHQAVHPSEPMYYSDGSSPNNVMPTLEHAPFDPNTHLNHASYASNSQSLIPASQDFNLERHTYGGDAQVSGPLPLPPWETPTVDNIQQTGRHPKLMRSFTQTPRTRSNQMMSIYGQQMPVLPMHIQPSSEIQFINSHSGQFQQIQENQMGSYLFGQRLQARFLDQRLHGANIQDDSDFRLPRKAEDMLFGDLVDIAKFKPKRSILGRNDTM